MRPIRVIAPAGTVVNARPPAAVAGGNVETSQRIVDVLLKALAQAIPDRIPAAAAGTMNNLTIGGIDPRTGAALRLLRNHRRRHGRAPHQRRRLRRPHAHDQLAQHAGRGPRIRLSLPPAPIFASPQQRRRGPSHGGDGIVREIEVLTDAQVTLLADRRTRGPYGLAGGRDGAPGRTIIIRNDGRRKNSPARPASACAPENESASSPPAAADGAKPSAEPRRAQSTRRRVP